MKRLVSLLLLLPLCCFGDLQQMIAERLEAGEKAIVIPPGRYEQTPLNGVHLRLENLADVTIDATGAELICTETTRAIQIQNCTNLTIRGLSVDYDPLPFTQGKIVEISEDRTSHIIEIMEGFPRADAVIASKHGVFRPDGTLRYGDYFDFQPEVLAEDRLKITINNKRRDGGEQVGDYVVVASRSGRRSVPHAIQVNECSGTVFERMTLFSSPTFGFFETHSSGSVYRNCVIDRREGRMRSLNADAFHSKYATVGPQIIGCRAMWQGDDCVNICGAYHVVSKTSGYDMRVLAKHHLDIQPGDSVELVNAEGQKLPEAKVRWVKPAGNTLEEEMEQLKQIRIRTDTQRSMKKAYVIRLNRKAHLPFGSLVASINRMGNGFAVKDCVFGNNRSRGILIKASNGEIIGNRVENSHMQGIKIAPEIYWLESGYSRNLVIANNTVIDCGKEALLVAPIGDNGSGFENINVSGNRFSSRLSPPVSYPSAGILFESNTVRGVK